MTLRFAVVGCGLIGKKRAATLAPGQLVVVCDSNPAAARAMVELYPSAESFTDFHEVVEHPSVDAVIIATPNVFLSQVSLAALEAGKHVLVEKPAAIDLREIDALAQKAADKKLILRVGFNHRYHPAFLKAREIFDSGILGPLMMIRSRYGHGGRIGYDQEWRADPAISGGGELIDQGVHLIDLARWFLGEFTTVEGHVTTSFWKMPVDDNAFLSLRTAEGQTAWLHASCSEWKNLFSFEIYGRVGKLQIDGLGGSYGQERLSYYAMKPEMGIPDTTVFEYPGGDESWKRELDSFVDDIQKSKISGPGIAEARACMSIVQTLYQRCNYPRL